MYVRASLLAPVIDVEIVDTDTSFLTYFFGAQSNFLTDAFSCYSWNKQPNSSPYRH